MEGIMKVLLVDDEDIVLKGLSKMIDWDKLDLDLCYLASSAEQAIEIIEKNHVDIIIYDITMEGMSGLDMLKYLNKKKMLEDKLVIILSGYQEFKYAQEAIKNNVFEYLTKPISRKNFAEVLASARDKLLINNNGEKKVGNKKVIFETVKQAQNYINEHFFDNIDFDDVSIDDYEKNLTRLIEIVKFSIDVDINNLIDNVLKQTAKKDAFQEHVFKKNIFSIYFEITNLLVENEVLIFNEDMKEKNKLNSFIEMQVWFHEQVNAVYLKLKEYKSQIKNDVIIKVKDYIDKNYAEQLTLHKMSAMAYMSPNYFCAVFKNRMGENLHDYILRIRMEKARELLLKKCYNIYEVAGMVSYNNARYFAEAFKKYYGVPPSAIKVE